MIATVPKGPRKTVALQKVEDLPGDALIQGAMPVAEENIIFKDRVPAGRQSDLRARV